MKKIIVIGGGISGLTAGVYAARAGFDVTILEQHNIVGGLSTSWSRKGYYFEGGMHWLTGSRSDLPLNRIWRENGALKENNPIENRDPLYTLFDENGKKVSIKRYLPDMQNELIAYAREDKRMIKKMCRDVKTFTHMHTMIIEEKGCKCRNPEPLKLGELIKMVPCILRVPYLVNVSYEDYVAKFKNKNLRHLLSSVIGYRYNALSFIYTLGSFASGDCGFPAGGSIRMANNILDTYKSLGGKIEFRTKAENIHVEDGHVTKVITNNGEFEADAVIVTQDARAAVDTLFDTMIDEPWVNTMRHDAITEQNIFIGLGVKADYSHLPYCCVFPLKEPFEYAGNKWNELRIYNYSAYKDHAPEGCTAITCLLIGDSYSYWKAAKSDGTYKDKKKELGELFVKTLSQFLPEVATNLEVIDVATPCTYERYCGSYEGSWMSVWKKGGKMSNYPQTLDSIEGVYFAGQRIQMPGGLPLAAYTGRLAVQKVCRDFDVEFI